MVRRGKPSLTPEEARRLHYEALVIDSQQPAVTGGLLFTEGMKGALEECHRRGMSRDEARLVMEAMAAREIQRVPEARKAYLDLWKRSGVTAACATYSATERPSQSFELTVQRLAQAHAIVGALDGELRLVRRAVDIEQAHREGKHGLVLDLQNTIAIGDDLERIETLYNLGVRMVQLTYNLRNLVGDGCTEVHKSGLTHFGREVVARLNDLGVLVDVSHCSEQVAWDALEVSKHPIVISHSSSGALCRHDRAKSDELARAVAKGGGYFGVVIIPGFIQETPEATLEDFCRHVEHLVEVMGIDHVGIGTDKTGPGPGTESLVQYPSGMPNLRPGAFNWTGFRPKEHRLEPHYHLKGYDNFGDWPNITIRLAQWGFTEEELRKLLGLNFLRVFRQVVG